MQCEWKLVDIERGKRAWGVSMPKVGNTSTLVAPSGSAKPPSRRHVVLGRPFARMVIADELGLFKRVRARTKQACKLRDVAASSFCILCFVLSPNLWNRHPLLHSKEPP